MDTQQLRTFLHIEKVFFQEKLFKTHSKRRFVADSLHKLNDDEKHGTDVFALTMNIFDRFFSKSNEKKFDFQLVALSAFNLAKKLRTNFSVNNENEQTSLIFAANHYTENEIFNGEQTILEALDWDLSSVISHDFLKVLLDSLFVEDFERNKIRIHVEILLCLSICEMNCLSIRASVLAGACLQATVKGLSLCNVSQIEEKISQLIQCQTIEIQSCQRLVEQYFHNCLQNILPNKNKRRCLAPIDSQNQMKTNQSTPRVK